MILFKDELVTTMRLTANKLREYRQENNIGLRELSRRAKVPHSTISAIELQRTHTTSKTAMKIENALIKMVQKNEKLYKIMNSKIKK